MKKISMIALIAIFAVVLTFTLVACSEQGPQGEKGDQGVQGIQGEKGDQGTGIENIVLNEDGNLVITLSDGTTQVLDHNWEKVCTIEPVECTLDGKDLYSCADCGLAKVVTIPQTGHTYSETVVAPTCFQQGYTLHKCACGDNYKDTFVDSDIEHDFKESDICRNCNQNIVDVAIECYNLSATADDNVHGYVVPNLCGPEGHCYDVYIKGIGKTKGYDYDGYTSGLFENEAHRFITAVYISDGVSSIGDGLLAGYYSLIRIEVDSNNAIYKSIDGDLYTKDGKTLVQKSSNQIGYEFVVPDGVTTIGKYAFTECKRLVSVIIPESVTEICEYAFADSGIKHINIPEGVINISRATFRGCYSLRSIVIPESVKTIGFEAFRDCTDLQKVYYAGTKEQWDEIVIENDGNGYLLAATFQYDYEYKQA
ncbi:MAG: leucine-rich repeat domain-containing protein [Clostridia bacterium]|nr:leucine-rich repeat domain-containing protein [Clostridia bacterium]